MNKERIFNMKMVVCLDQEGVITKNHESEHGCQYFNIFPQDIELRQGVIEAFEILWENKADVYIVTNQAWVTIASMSKDDETALKALDACKRARIVQLLGKYSELIKGWRTSYVVEDGLDRSKAKSEHLIEIITDNDYYKNEVSAFWIGDTMSDLHAGNIANTRLDGFSEYAKYDIGLVYHGGKTIEEIQQLYESIMRMIPNHFACNLPFCLGQSLFLIISCMLHNSTRQLKKNTNAVVEMPQGIRQYAKRGVRLITPA